MVLRLLFTPALLRLTGIRSNRASFERVVGVAGFSVNSMAGESEVLQGVKLLSGENDNYGGVIVEIKEHMDSNVFAPTLKASVAQWKKQGKKGLWIKLPIEHVNLVETAVKEGFWYHHAEPNYLMLAYWIPEIGSTLPANASHRVGVGAFIMNEKKEILVVQENSGRFQGTGIWKFPTGVVNEGEDICAAAIREVKEETSIDTKFIEVLSFRQSHKSFFGKSDLFFMCLLEPLSFDIQMDESELVAAQWMPFEEFSALPFVKENEMLKYIVDICRANQDGKYHGFSSTPTTSFFSKKRYNLYCNKFDLQEDE